MSRRVVLGVLPVLCTASTAGQNLIKNPGFESLDGDAPSHWQLFVMGPEEHGTAAAAAEGRIDSEVAHEGRCSALLRNRQAYDREPFNNWSQSLLAPPVGKELIISGYIKTDEASEAALWIQCWRQNPWGVVRFATTSTDSPMRGTRDWTRVEMRVHVPTDTNYVVVRCVLAGRGAAWFDDIQVVDAAEKGHRAALEDIGDGGEKDRAGAEAASAELKALREAHAALLESHRALRESNTALIEQVRFLREELESIRSQLTASSPAALTEEGLTRQAGGQERQPDRPPPPLVPHGYLYEEVP